jgi:hypothetical protein
LGPDSLLELHSGRIGMRKIISFVILLFLATHGTAAAEVERVIFDNNEYGGVTKEIIYSEDDANFKKGMYKVIASYDKDGRRLF